MKAFIYQWTNNLNGKKYIGSHIGEPEDGYAGSGSYFKKAFNKYKDFFTREILETIDGENVYDRIKILEESYLQKVDAANNSNYYNITNSYYGGNVYQGLSIDDKKKMIEGRTNAAKNDRLKNPQKYEDIAKKKSAIQREKGKDVYQFTKDGQFIAKYSCLEEAHKITNISKGNLHCALNASRNFASGFRWSYKNIPNDLIPPKKRNHKSTGKQKNPSKHINIIYVQIIQCDLKGNEIHTWNNKNEIQEHLGISAQMINHAINGRGKNNTGEYKGFIWKKGKQIKTTKYN
jgi:hypothetical protein